MHKLSNKQLVNCKQCNVPLWKIPSIIKKAKHGVFCSRSCVGKFSGKIPRKIMERGPCKEEGCRTKSYLQDLCRRHYGRMIGRKPEHAKYRSEHQKSETSRYRVVKNRAISLDLEFNITKEEFHKLTCSKCYYCNEFSFGREYCGLDRLNNLKGYISDNVVASCSQCNYMKRAMDKAEFLDIIKKISTNLNLTGLAQNGIDKLSSTEWSRKNL